jgi:amino acid permease
MITSTRKLTGKDDITNLDIQPTEDVNSLKHGEIAVGNWGSETKREFKSRHLSMLAVGGTIGYVFRFIRFFHVI